MVSFLSSSICLHSILGIVYCKQNQTALVSIFDKQKLKSKKKVTPKNKKPTCVTKPKIAH